MLESEDEELWAAIADPSRRRLIDALLMAGESTQSALAADLPFTRQAVAKHLDVLERVGLVKSEKHGREVRYRMVHARLDVATSSMSRVAARWDARLNSLKRIAESAYATDKAKRVRS
jgi:ArsR family transcriptional regulator, cadmium/lead-responsive transcriptional repressor